jgi:hypothetical protein
MSNRNRNTGHSLERECVNKFKELGFKHVKSSRLVNRSRDNHKIDLANEDELENGRFPFNVQCKSITGTLNYVKVLEEIPTVKGLKNVVIHKRTEKSENGLRFMTKGKYAFMHASDFFELVGELQHYKSLINAK